MFVGSFLGRSLFDIDPHQDPQSPAEFAMQQDERRAERRLELRRWLESLAAGRDEPLPPECEGCDSWSDELQVSFDAARRTANADGRLELYQAAEQGRWPPFRGDPTMGLRDADPVVRYLVLRRWPHRESIPEDLLRDLRSDPSEMVRLLARKSFPAHD